MQDEIANRQKLVVEAHASAKQDAEAAIATERVKCGETVAQYVEQVEAAEVQIAAFEKQIQQRKTTEADGNALAAAEKKFEEEKAELKEAAKLRSEAQVAKERAKLKKENQAQLAASEHQWKDKLKKVEEEWEERYRRASQSQ